jgi:helicase-like protein
MRKNPERWRMVVFTGRLETQTTIQAFLEERGLKVGIINGSSGQRNQNTIARFWKNPPDCHVIVSTEAGSEGVNLQVANVLVNYDLPWNPMIVEQRIGRIQRLASEHKSVSILNIILKGTFEEHIVGRLMEKLQMASHAIGDIEALLEASGDEENGGSFDEKILQLVLAALAGRDVGEATRQAEQSIIEAKAKLEEEEANINAMLGSMEGAEYVGPRAPKLPPTLRSMDAREFTLTAFKSLGAQVTRQESGLYLVEEDGGREWIRFDETVDGDQRATLYAPGFAAFSRLVSRMIATGVHQVKDSDDDPARQADNITRHWVGGFGATPIATKVEGVRRCFEGKALVRVRATVAHDSYERLVEVTCAPGEHKAHAVRSGLYKLTDVIENAHHLGIDNERLADAAGRDPGIAEFCRFYIERRAQEVAAAGDDARKRKKLEDDFTPRLESTVVALEGTVHREVTTEVQYRFADAPYASRLTVVPQTGAWMNAPELGRCEITAGLPPKNASGIAQ